MTYQATIERIKTTGGNEGKMAETLRRIGSAIRAASTYPPIRNHAAAIAGRAAPKDFLGQLNAIYDDFIHRWKYVKDPVGFELVTSSPEAVWRLTMAGDNIGVGLGVGAGDCDCATVALGAELQAIGFPVRIGTTTGLQAPPGRLFSHVFIQAQPSPKIGWVTVDPVLHPTQPFGGIAKHSRIAWWDLDGNLLGYSGNFTGLHGIEEEKMYGENIEQWPDYGFGSLVDDGTSEPQDWSTVGLSGWGFINTPQGPISAVETYGYIDGTQLNGLLAEVDLEEYNGRALARTPMLELSLGDYEYMRRFGVPYDGMLALGDTGETYYYDGLGGFFKKLFRRAKRFVKKVAKRVRKGLRKVISKIPGGKFLLKIGDKLKKIAMKIVRPLMKFVGKWAGKLAPIAAMIPGYGTAIAAGLMVAGRIAKVMNKFDAVTRGAAGSVRGLKLKDPRKLPALHAALKAEAAQMKIHAKRNPAAFRSLLARARSAGR